MGWQTGLSVQGELPRHEGSITTLFTAQVEFDRAGMWGLDLDAAGDGVDASGMRRTFLVQEQTSEPAVGDPAPRSEHRVLGEEFTLADARGRLAESVRQRLLNLARASGVGHEYLLLRYANERLLCRLSRSDAHHYFVLKGSIVLLVRDARWRAGSVMSTSLPQPRWQSSTRRRLA